MATYVVIDDAEVAPEAPITTSLMTRLRDNALAYLGAATGTRILLQQTAAPLGWTKDTTHTDKGIRLTSGTVGSGGSVGFNTVFARTATDGHALTIAETAAHNHGGTAAGSANYTKTNQGSTFNAAAGGTTVVASLSQVTDAVTSLAVTITSEGGGNAHVHNIDLRLQYVDVCLFEKAA